MRTSHPPNATRFFARVRAAVLECPACGHVISFGQPRDAQAGSWDKTTSRLTCPQCQRVFLLGILAWPTRKGGARVSNTLPRDQVPDERQRAELRAQARGWWMPEDQAKGRWRPDDTNGTAVCTCTLRPSGDREWEDPNCPACHPREVE